MKYLKEFATQQEYEAYINGNPDLPNVSLIDENGSVKYNEKPDYSKEYLTFVALEDGTFSISGNNSVDYSLDGGETWVSLPSYTSTPTIHQGDKIMWKGELTPTSRGIGRFLSTGQYDVEGNPMSLLYGDNFIGQTSLTGKDSAFKFLLYESTGLINAKNLVLPATTLSDNCYESMFFGCTSLVTAPELPATTLTRYCYSAMFLGCTSLVTAPELPATTASNFCYNGLFLNCTNLNYIKMLATTIYSSSFDNWVYGVSATGTFVKASSATLPTGDNGIPSGWEVINE